MIRTYTKIEQLKKTLDLKSKYDEHKDNFVRVKGHFESS